MASSSNNTTEQRTLRTSSLDVSFRFAVNQDYHKTSLLFHQKRWKHAGKMGHEIESLKEMAHRPERETAQERRKKKKDRKAAKKGGSKVTENETAIAHVNDGDDDDDDLYFDDDDDDDDNLNEDGEPTLPDMVAVQTKMDAVLDRFQDSLKSIRGAEPTADMFDDVMVQAYGAATPLNAVAQVVITSPTLAQLTCFDPAVAKDVVKAVQLTLELNPQLEEGGGGNIKVPLPRVSMEVREKLSKSVKKRAESCKQRLRGVRRKYMDVVKKGKDGKLAGVSKDDAFASGKDIEAANEAAAETLKTIVAEKMDSIMMV
jgi:ribosome recycling factor